MSVTQSAAYESSGVVGTAAIEAVAGIAVIVLTILGLAHVAPVFLVAIATIIAGIALIAQGSTIAAEYARILSTRADLIVPVGMSSTWSLALLAGAAGIVLGILALLNLFPTELVAIAVIAFGGGLILSSGPIAQIAVLRSSGSVVDERIRRMTAEVAAQSAVSQGLVGLGAVVLGILALAGFATLTLILIALLSIGVFLLVNGSTVGGLMLSFFRR